MVERKKWILYKHTNSYELIKAVALDVKNSCKTDISDVEMQRMKQRLAALDMYKTRGTQVGHLDAIKHRINTLQYYMFGYKQGRGKDKKFIFSPLGNLFLKHIGDEEKLQKIFITMLFAIQFRHPGSGTDKSFQLYPFRLIFKLLTDERLSYKLYNAEVEYLLMFVNNINKSSYEKLVQQVIDFRNLSIEEKARRFMADEHTYVNCVYEWEYYSLTLFDAIGILEKTHGEKICELYHPQKAASKSPATKRTATNGYTQIPTKHIAFVEQMLRQYSFEDSPLNLDDKERMQIDVIKEIYNFYPKLLLDAIGESEELSKALELPKLIEKYSNNPKNETAYLFEQVLTEGFNVFHNVEATWKGGAGQADIEGLYITKNKKFAVDAKSTANKLLGINPSRLKEHRDAIGGEYSIVITPRYVPAAKRDIKEQAIVIILASTFAEYLYNHIFHDVRNVDYEDFDRIIMANLGQDISKLISYITLEKFATIV